MDLLDCLGQFTTIEKRKQSAKNIAEVLNAEDLFIFIKDPELNTLIPAHGFSQNLRNGMGWKNFLSLGDKEVFKGMVPYENIFCPAIAVKGHDQYIAVLIGGSPKEEDIILLKKLMNLAVPLLIQENLTLIAESKAKHNVKLTEKAERLTFTLDGIRHNLTKVLEENSNLLQLTKEQNEELAAANEELVAANEEVMAGIEELNITNNRLLSINADLDNFVYTASHDLKTPVSNIEGLMNLLNKMLNKNGWEDDTTKEIVVMINNSIKRFKETIKDLAEITKIGTEITNPLHQVNINEVINDVQTDLHISILESEAQISVEILDDASIYYSKKNFKSIIYNLLSNAIKYKHPSRKPIIKINWKEKPDYYVLIVKDNGLGMDTSDKTKIFGLFKRLHSHVEGTGIGLYIVKKIIENAGGKIELESTIGEGTTFSIYFKNY